MAAPSEAPSTGPRFWFAALAAGLLTWIVHEGAHWLMGTALGYDMWISLNQVGLRDGQYESALHRNLVSAAGPIITYLQAAVALRLLIKDKGRGRGYAYAFLFFAAYTRAVAMMISFFAHPNDESRISLDLGLPHWGIPAVVVTVLVGMTWAGSRSQRFGWRVNGWMYALASALTAVIVFSDDYVRAIVQGG